jgi:hypothetical protein
VYQANEENETQFLVVVAWRGRAGVDGNMERPTMAVGFSASCVFMEKGKRRGK